MLDAATFGQELAAMVKAQIAPLLSKMDALEKRLDDMPAAKDGKDADPEAVASIVRDQIKGDLDELRIAVGSIVIPEPVSVDVEAIAKAAAQMIPTPKDGATGKDGEPGKDGAPGEKGRDGLDVKDLFRAEGGRLIAVMSDGQTKDLGEFVGKDGEPGKDGRDGLGFEDMAFEEKDGRLYAVFKRGDIAKEARLPGISYRGVWKSGEYLTGDSVTFGSCQWIATADTEEKPGEGKAWQLAVRKGRDGKDGELKAAKPADPVRVGVPKDGK